MAPPRSRLDQANISLAIPRLPIHVMLAIFLVSLKIRNSRGAFYTPCNYPVPMSPSFDTQCSNNYLKSAYTCDVDGQISIAAVEKINSILSKYDIFSQKYVGVGLAVLRILEYPNWTLVQLTDPQEEAGQQDDLSNGDHSDIDSGSSQGSMDGQDSDDPDSHSAKIRRHDQSADPNIASPTRNPDWYCLKKSQADYFRHLDPNAQQNNVSLVHYLQTFADALRRRWFGQECGAGLLFLAITQSVVDSQSDRTLLENPVIQVSMGEQLEQVLPTGFSRSLQSDVSFLLSRDWSPQPILLALERIGQKVTPQLLTEERVSKLVVDVNGRSYEVTPVIVYHTIPTWAIYTFIGCLGSVGLALALEWTIVRRKALTLRAGGSGGGGERQRSSKSDNVQVHLYF